MKYYQARAKKLPGTDFREVHRNARRIYDQIIKKTKRRAYIRSRYFNRGKVFLDLFWSHLHAKKIQDRFRRIKFYAAGIELTMCSTIKPETKEDPNDKGIMLHRFKGASKENEFFYVQIKEDKRNGQKYLISIFPEK